MTLVSLAVRLKHKTILEGLITSDTYATHSTLPEYFIEIIKSGIIKGVKGRISVSRNLNYRFLAKTELPYLLVVNLSKIKNNYKVKSTLDKMDLGRSGKSISNACEEIIFSDGLSIKQYVEFIIVPDFSKNYDKYVGSYLMGIDDSNDIHIPKSWDDFVNYLKKLTNIKLVFSNEQGTNPEHSQGLSKIIRDNISEASTAKKLTKDIKIVDGKKKVVISKEYVEDCKPGWKRDSESGRCVKMSLSEQRNRSNSATKAANNPKTKINKATSMRRRSSLIGDQ